MLTPALLADVLAVDAEPHTCLVSGKPTVVVKQSQLEQQAA
ncbi:MAG: hypothetical protein Q4E06_09870 [Lautropia sp.]|nr:hypothetical protein [Lautropia sp.]